METVSDLIFVVQVRTEKSGSTPLSKGINDQRSTEWYRTGKELRQVREFHLRSNFTKINLVKNHLK